MVVTDPVDARLLAAVAELGRAAVHDVAARVGMDPREVASRLIALSASGLPLLVGVECDPNGIRSALANAGRQPGPGAPNPAQPGPAPQAPPQQGPPAQQGPPPQGPHGTPSGPYSVQGTPSGPYSVQGTPSGPYSVQGTPSGPYPVYAPAGGYPAQHGAQGQPGGYPAPHHPYAQQTAPAPQAPQPGASVQTQPPPAPEVPGPELFGTWGPPQTASWARGDQTAQDAERTRPAIDPRRSGTVGQTLETVGLEGEQLAIQLVELVDPADSLYTAAGYKLADGERAVVVHTELTNYSNVPFPSLPDLYLVLVADDGTAISKAPVALSSRPSYQIGVRPGETTGGHTVFVLGDAVRLREVRWSPQPGDEKRSLRWAVED